MGIGFVNSSSLTEYINANFPSGKELSTFNSGIEFSFESSYQIASRVELGVEYAFTTFSHNTNIAGGSFYELSYNHHKPSIIAYYIIPGNGYKFKFGGGAGYRYVALTEKILSEDNYNAEGIGFLLKAQGHTSLGGNLNATIGFNIRYDLPGELKSGNKRIFDNTVNENVDLNSISFVVHVGVSYFF
jgi:hypothetical protein